MTENRGVSLPGGMAYEESPFGSRPAEQYPSYPPPPPLRPAPVQWGPVPRVDVPGWLPQYPAHVSPPPIVPPPMRPPGPQQYGVKIGIGRPLFWGILTFLSCGLALPFWLLSLYLKNRKPKIVITPMR